MRLMRKRGSGMVNNRRRTRSRYAIILWAILTATLVTDVTAQVEEITLETGAGPHEMVFVPAGEFLMGYTRLSATLRWGTYS